MSARGPVPARFARGGSSAGRRPRRFPAAAAASQASCLARCASRRAVSRPPAGPGQPLPPPGPAGQRRGVVAAGYHLGERRRRPPRPGSSRSAAASGSPSARRSGQLRPVQAQHAGDTMPSAASSRSTWLNSPPSASSCRTRNRAMVHDRVQPAGDHPVGHIAHAPLPGHPADRSPCSTRHSSRPSSPGSNAARPCPSAGTGGGTRPDPRWPPRPARRRPDRPRAAIHACPPAAATADHAAGKGNPATHTIIPGAGCPTEARRLWRQAEICRPTGAC